MVTELSWDACLESLRRGLPFRLPATIGQRVERVQRAVAETFRPWGVAMGYGADHLRTRDELLVLGAFHHDDRRAA